MKRILFISLAVVGMMAAVPSANATVLTPGSSSVVISGSTLVGLTLVDTWSAAPSALGPPSVGGQKIFGTYQEWVYKDNITGLLTFLEQVAITNPVAIPPPFGQTVHRVTVSDYTGFTTDVTILAGLPATGGPLVGGVPPNNTPPASVIDRSVDGDAIGFDFRVVQLSPGTHTVILAVKTNAKSYDRLGTVSVIDGSTSTNLTFQPTGAPVAVPEPSTMAIAGLGGLGLIGFGLRRRKATGA